jgi:hypothetical protein
MRLPAVLLYFDDKKGRKNVKKIAKREKDEKKERLRFWNRLN